MYAEVEELEDYVYGVTERRAQALGAHRAGALQRVCTVCVPPVA